MNYSTPLWKTNEGQTASLSNSSVNNYCRNDVRQVFRLVGFLLLLVFSTGTETYALKYSSVLSTNNTNAANGTVCSGATRVGLYSFTLVINQNNGGSDATPVLSSVTYTTTGTYTSSDITTGYKLYYSTSPTGLATATQIGTTLSVAGPGTRTFSGLATTLATGTYYFWITVDINSSITAGHTITNASTLPTANVVFSTTLTNGSTGTSPAGNTQTLTPPPATITGTASACVNATTTLANTVSGGTWSSASTGIATVGSTTGVVTGAGAGNTTITYSNGCGTAATQAVTINALPTAFSVTGGGGYCTGGSGAPVGLGGSQSGVNYQLYLGSGTTGSPVSGTGSSIAFGSQTAAGSYTVRATNSTTSCVSGMTGSATVTVNSLPNTFSVTGGGNYCSGGSGISVGLGGSQSGVNYQLYNGSSTTGSPVSGTGSSISFGSQTAAGTYTVRATNASTSCVSDMSSSATVSINALPTTFTVTGGGNYCSGGSGVSVGLGGSESGVNYQLYKGSATTGSPVSGTGSSLDFGAQTAAGTYTVRATNASTSCVAGMTSSASVNVDALPTTFTVTGGGNYCTGGSGVSVGLGGSQSGVNYQLYNGSSVAGSPVSGTGSSISFGAQTSAGSYTVRATNATTSCVSGMTGSASVNIDALPTVFNVTGGGNYCSGGSGVSVGLDGSQSSVNYQLYNGSSSTGSPVPGTGSSISFPAQTAAGSYTVRATNSSTSCISGMTGSAAVNIDALPASFTLTGGGNYCSGGSGVNVGLDGSQSGINYQLYNGSSAAGSPVSGTGSSLDFGSQTSAGTYTVRATNTTTSCVSGMTSSASVSINPLPTTFTMNGGGNYCSGGSGMSVGLGGSQSGVNYQLYNGSSTAGSPVPGTGSAITFGAQTSAGTYTVHASNASTSCASDMTGSASVSIDPLPNTFTVTGGGNYCSGGSGVNVGLDGSQSGVNYQLYTGSSTTGSPVSGTGSALDFGTQTSAGTYTVRATNGSTSCISGMTGSATIITDPLPTTFTVTGGGNYCTGGSGVSVGLDGTQSGVDYQLYNGSSTTGSAVSGTGSAITFGAQTAGTYTVRATNASTSCQSGMTGSAPVSIDPLPTTFTVTGGGNYCSGGSGVNVGLDGSQSGVDYQLYNGSSSAGSAVSGTGGAITFSAQTAAGTYTVRATNNSTSCTSGMTGSTSVNIDPLPTTFTITGGGNYCSGGSGISVGLDGSQSGVNYQLYNGSSTTGSAVSGTGGAITFASQTAAGSYTVRATNTSTSCASGMTGSTSVGIDPLPNTFTVTGGGNYCSAGLGVSVGLDGSQSGVDYQLYSGSSASGSAVSGTGSAITFGSQTAAGTYTVRATNTSTSCVSGMTGSASVNVDPLPTTFIVSGGGNYCTGGSGVSVGLNGSQSGVDYQLYNGPSSTGSAVSGTGSAITFGAQTAAGTYTVRATNSSTSCVFGMTGSAAVSIDPLPSTFTVTGGGNYCSGGSGVSVGLDGSQSGVDYQLYSGSSVSGSAVSGTGSAITFGAQTSAGTYTVRATSGASCVSGMTGSTSVSIDPLPVTFTVTGGGSYCTGGSGVSVGLNGSESGVNYQLYKGSSTVGSAIGGTGSTITFGSQTVAGTYTVLASDATTSCTSSMSNSAVVSVDGLPTTFTVTGGGNYCSGGAGVSVGLDGSQTGVDYQLYSGSSTTGSPVSGTGSVLSFGAQTASGSYTVRATSSSTSCVNSMTGSATVSIDPLPGSFTVTGGGNYCSGGSGVTVGLDGSQSGIDYQLYNGSSSTGSAVSGTGIAITFGTQMAAGTYTVRATNSSTSCVSGMTGSTSVSIDPLPTTFTVTGGGIYCPGGSLVDIGLGGSQTGVNYQLYNGAATAGSPVSGTGAAIAFDPQSDAGSYTVVATNTTTSCVNNMSGNALVATGTLPSGGTITGTATVCESNQTTLSNATTGGNWSSENEAVATITSAGIVTGLSAGTVTISYTVTNSCGSATATQVVTVNPSPDAGTISGTATVCAGNTTSLSSTVSGGAWASNNPSVASIGSSGLVAASTTGNATISYTVTGGCGSATATIVVTVNDIPSAGAITGAPTMCASATTTLTDPVNGGAWASSDESVAVVSSGIVSGVSAGTAEISYTKSNSCGANVATYAVTVNPITGSAGTISGTSTMCTGANTTLSTTGFGGNWSSSNTSIASVSGGVVNGSSAGTATISYTVTGCGAGVATNVVTVSGTPSAGVITGPSAVSITGTITLSDAVSGGAWSGSNSFATVSPTGVITGIAEGSVLVSYTVVTSCGTGMTTKSINVVTAIGGNSGTLTVCVAQTTALSNSTPGGSWSSNNTSIATVSSTGVVTGVAAGIATISYITSGGTATSAVTVNSTPTVITGLSAICEGATTTLNNTAVGYGVWTSSNTAVANVGSSTGYVTGISGGTAAITYTLSTGCLGSTVVTVNSLPAAITGAGSMCPGTAVTLASSTPGGSWTSGDATVATVNSSGVTTGVANGITNITYTLGTGCKTAAMVTVNALPSSITGSAAVCEGTTTYLSNSTPGGSWSSSNTAIVTIGTSGAANGLTAGTSTISYITGSGCSRSIVVTVNQAPSISGTVAVCPGISSTLTANIPGGSWTGGNAAIATINSAGVVTGIGSGTTNFTYTVSTGCKDYAIATVNTTPASITGTMKACTGNSTTLGDVTAGGNWSSSDVTVATIGSASGIVNGLSNGTTTITYSTGLGCYRTGNVTINPTPGAITGNSPVCVGSSFTLSDATPGLSWSSSNTAVATIASNGVVTGTGAGIATITYTASTNCMVSTDVTINAAPAAITGSSTGCVGSTVTLSNTIPGGTWSSNNTAVATIGISNGIVMGVTSGMATLTYSGGAGCYQTKSITINNAPTITGYATACIGLTTTLSGGTSGTWSSGSPSVATVTTSGGYVTGASAGTAVMTFTSAAYSCPGTYAVTVIPVPGAITGATSACSGSVVTFSNGTPGGSWSSSNTAVATVGSATGIVTAVGSGGTATISYSFGNNCRVTSSFSPKAMPALIGGTPSVCMPVVTTLTDVTTGGTWSSSNSAVATVGSSGSVGNGVVSGVSAGTSEITYTITSTGCARSVVVTVTVGPDPGTLTSSTGLYSLRTASSPTSLTLTSSGTPGGAWSSSNTGVATVSGTGVVSAVAAGNTTITYTVTGACTNRSTRYITVSSGKSAGASAALADFVLYPNPTTGSFTMTTAEGGTMTIYAMDGREVYTFDVASGTALYTLKQGIASGVYICRFASTNGSTANVRLVYEP